MPITIEINGTLIEGVNHIQKGSVQIEKRIEERSTASFIVVDLLAGSNYVKGMPVEVSDPVPNLIFSGFIDTPSRGRIAPNVGLLHEISCIDNHYLVDKRLVVKSYLNQTLGDIVNDIWTDYLQAEGITIGEVQTGPTIKSAIFNYVKVSECFDALKELSGLTWFINELLKLYFIDRATYTAPFNIDMVTHIPVKGSVRLSTGNPMYRNTQYVRGGKGETALQIQNFTGDGILKSFTLGYPLAKVPVITHDGGAPLNIGIKGIDSGKDYYWNKGDATVYAEVAPGVGVDVEIQYYGQFPLITMSKDSTAIANRQTIEGGTGIVEEIATETYHETADSINESAVTKLKLYCQDAERFIYQTEEYGLAPGQIQKITYMPFGFTNHEMLIESVIITAVGEDVRYDVSCITGPVMGSWAKFFSNLLTRQDKTIQIGDSLLLVLLQQAEIIELSEATAIYEDEFEVSGQVNRWLNTPPIGAGSLTNVEHERLELAEATAITDAITEWYRWG